MDFFVIFMIGFYSSLFASFINSSINSSAFVLLPVSSSVFNDNNKVNNSKRFISSFMDSTPFAQCVFRYPHYKRDWERCKVLLNCQGSCRLTQVSFSAILLIREDTRWKRAEPFVLVTFYVFPCFSICWKCNFAIWDIPITKHEIRYLYTSLY